jgi:hypothetical protein
VVTRGQSFSTTRHRRRAHITPTGTVSTIESVEPATLKRIAALPEAFSTPR